MGWEDTRDAGILARARLRGASGGGSCPRRICCAAGEPGTRAPKSAGASYSTADAGPDGDSDAAKTTADAGTHARSDTESGSDADRGSLADCDASRFPGRVALPGNRPVARRITDSLTARSDSDSGHDYPCPGGAASKAGDTAQRHGHGSRRRERRGE